MRAAGGWYALDHIGYDSGEVEAGDDADAEIDDNADLGDGVENAEVEREEGGLYKQCRGGIEDDEDQVKLPTDVTKLTQMSHSDVLFLLP